MTLALIAFGAGCFAGFIVSVVLLLRDYKVNIL